MGDVQFLSSTGMSKKPISARMVHGKPMATGMSVVNMASEPLTRGEISLGGTFGAVGVRAYMGESPNVIAKLVEQISQLSERVAALESEVWEYDAREISETEAKEEIAAFFEEHHGETIYPSDVATSLRLDYDLVAKAIEQLERDGKVGEAAT